MLRSSLRYNHLVCPNKHKLTFVQMVSSRGNVKSYPPMHCGSCLSSWEKIVTKDVAT